VHSLIGKSSQEGNVVGAELKLIIGKGNTVGQFANLPSAFKSPAKGTALNKHIIQEKLEILKRHDLRLLKEAAGFLSQINRYSIKSDKRIEMSNAILANVYMFMAKHYQKYQSKVLSLPESKDQREILLACIEIAEQAAISFKHHFREIYSAKSLGYRRNRIECVETSVRILELLRMEQRFRALRHQKLPQSSWLDVNRVFFSMLVHQDVDEPIKLLGSIGTWVKSSKNGLTQTPSVTARSLYISIQLFGLIDAPSWSSRLFHAPDAYLAYVTDAMKLHTDNKKPLEPGWLVTHIDNKSGPLFQRDANLTDPSIMIEYVNLYNRLVMDYEELAKMKFLGTFDASKLSKPLLDLEAIERFPFLESMLFGLRPRERKQKRHTAFGHEKLKLYFGFRDTYSVLMDLADENIKRMTNTRGFKDTLASASSAIVDDLSAYNNTNWEIVNFSTGGILVLTRETQFTNPIQVGQLVAFNPNEAVKRPLLGYVSRINRPSDQQVEVAIVRFSNHAEAAIAKFENKGNNPLGEGVVIFQSMEGRWCLIATHDYDFTPGTPFKLLRENNQSLPARLGNVMLTKQEFIVFELSAPGM